MGEGGNENKFGKKQFQEHGPKTSAKKWTDRDNNPCVAEADASYKCLHETNFDRKSCQTYFVNYQNCQRFWMNISKERRRLGIKPSLPPPEERDRILQEMG
ncbi:coiled-coil-helix-coiled-coil-helix domain-containing protein 7-like [Acanthaster planci]|uniref:Coiled-coil-helix-coiled-coil-helix domain-containing protein 7 n=1 Tax=Acanthaster planci TaxID=133434 RepID=A0A8B7YUT6_ACAPL|nr:coiled-coil-helix-coiled-coil-helix domain-containing protein 7-like [Acanthaster planci]XP_022097070.1 coiled-coil-helix-coiled-coil-helix domain-containing protein 7-like [Acanthaster planci]